MNDRPRGRPATDPAAVSPRRHAPWRRLLAVWLAPFVFVDLALAAEIVLRLRARTARQAIAGLEQGNAFVQGADNALHRDLWAERWRRYKPNARLDFTAENGDRFLVTINSHGFRTPEFAVPKPPGTLRIACVGASTTVQGRRDDETYPALLAAALRQRFSQVDLEVLNLGVSGTRSDFWLSRLDHFDALEPDIVVQYNGVNDIVQTYFDTFAAEHPIKGTLYARSHFVSRWIPLSRRDFDSGFATTLANLAALRRHVRERGGILIGATFAAPSYAGADSTLRQYLDYVTAAWSRGRVLDYRQYHRLLDELNARIRSQAEADSLPLVDLAASLSDPELFTDLCHMNPRGIAAMAQSFLPWVSAAVEARTGAVPGDSPSEPGGGPGVEIRAP